MAKPPKSRKPQITRQTSRRGKDGRFTKKGGKKEKYQTRRVAGKITASIPSRKGRTITKTVSNKLLTEWNGHIAKAFESTNLTTQLKDSKRIEIFVEGFREKHLRFKASIDTSAIKKKDSIFGVVLHRILDELAERGYRTQYDIGEQDWQHTRSYKKFRRVKLAGKWIEIRRGKKSKWYRLREKRVRLPSVKRGKRRYKDISVIKIGARLIPVSKSGVTIKGKRHHIKNRYTYYTYLQRRTREFSSKLRPLTKTKIIAKVFK